MKKIFYIMSVLILSSFFISACSDNNGSTIIGNTDPNKITISKLSDAGTATITIPLAIFGNSASDVQGATIDISVNGVVTDTGIVAADYYSAADEIVIFIVSSLNSGDEISFTIHLADGTSLVYSGIVSSSASTHATDMVFTQVSSGNFHACALTDVGSIMCWGEGSYGRLGNGDTTDENSPVYVVNSSGEVLTDFVQVSAGVSHTCGLKNDGSIMCWGYNGKGNLGNGNTTNQNTPVYVTDSVGTTLTDFSQVSSGRSSTCGLKNDGSIMCWGWNDKGQLGSGDKVNQTNPVYVVDSSSAIIHSFSQIDVGGDYACALTNSSSIMCWGSGEANRLGDHQTHNPFVDQVNPVYVIDAVGNMITDFTQVSTASSSLYSNTCGTMSDDSVLCWGGSYNGKLGNGDANAAGATDPENVIDSSEDILTNFSEVSVGFYHSCALTNVGSIMCWGFGLHGEIGNGSTTGTNAFALFVTDDSGTTLNNFTQVDSGQAYTCALTTNGLIMCWGQGGYGTLGNGSTDQQTYPVLVEVE